MSTEAASNQTELMLNQLQLGVTGTTVVMICRMWDVNAATGRYLSTDFIVSDVEGNLMHCTTRGSITHNFLRLKEGAIYSVKNLAVQPNKDDFRVMRYADFMLEFNGATTVCKAFVKYEGFIRSTQENTGSRTLDFYIANCRGKSIRVMLWGGLDELLVEKRTHHVRLYLIVLTAVTVKLYNSNTSSTLIVDNDQIPVLKQLKKDDSGVELTKETLPAANIEAKADTLKNLLMWPSLTFNCEVKIDKVRTKRGWNYPSCGGEKCKKGMITRKEGKLWCDSCNNPVEYPLELEVSNDTAKAVVVMFDETAATLVKCSADLILGSEEEHSGLPPAIANIVATSHTLELKSHINYEHGTYESFTCWKVVTDEVMEESASFGMVAANAGSKAPVLKSLTKTLLLGLRKVSVTSIISFDSS
ncbi:reverse transcriptase domain-containing protein [Tanacetum coccineum]